MGTRWESSRTWLTGVVLTHLGVVMVHGGTHVAGQVPLSRAATVFVYVVIVAGPLAGLALMQRLPRLGGWVCCAALAGALVFGVLNHFMLAGPDHVVYGAPGWRTGFAVTAVLLAATEAWGVGLSATMVRQYDRVGDRQVTSAPRA